LQELARQGQTPGRVKTHGEEISSKSGERGTVTLSLAAGELTHRQEKTHDQNNTTNQGNGGHEKEISRLEM